MSCAIFLFKHPHGLCFDAPLDLTSTPEERVCRTVFLLEI
jgi:hypothetical protein